MLFSGGAADVCELMPGDEIVCINGAQVAHHYQDSVQMVIDNAVKCGHIELKIKRLLNKGTAASQIQHLFFSFLLL
jgi:hypothetical protein